MFTTFTPAAVDVSGERMQFHDFLQFLPRPTVITHPTYDSSVYGPLITGFYGRGRGDNRGEGWDSLLKEEGNNGMQGDTRESHQ